MSIGTVALKMVRRLVAPALLSGFLFALILLLILFADDGGTTAPGSTERFLYNTAGMVGLIMFFSTPIIAPSILLVGLPSGYLVARLRAGLLLSLLMMLAIGAISGMLIIAMLTEAPAARLYSLSGPLVMVGVFPGAVTAFTWTLLNTDLFRRAAPTHL